MSKRTHAALAAVVIPAAALVVALAISAGASKPNDLPVFGPGSQYRPVIEPADFSANITNKWFPLAPGTTLSYAGTKDGEPATDQVTVLNRTLVIDGVTTRAVLDRGYLNGELEERTIDYYAQDDDGNVWYFGEDTVARDDNGNLTDTEGSFRAGVDGAQPGVIMQKHPEIGRQFRQEWYAGHAEDQFVAVDRHADVTVPYKSYRNALKTEEVTDLEPGVLDNKFYARGIGEVAERSVQGPPEFLNLVKIER